MRIHAAEEHLVHITTASWLYVYNIVDALKAQPVI